MPAPLARFVRHLIRVLLATLLLCHGAWSAAQAPADDLKITGQSLDRIEQSLRRQDIGIAQLADWLKQLAVIKTQTADCVSDAQQRLADVNKRILALGAPVHGESGAVSRARDALNDNKSAQEKRLASCQLLRLRSDDLAQQAGTVQQNLVHRELFARGPTLARLLTENLRQAPDWIAASREYLNKQSGLEHLTADDGQTLAVVMLMALALGIALRRRLRRGGAQAAPGRSIALALGRYAPPLLMSAALAGFFYVTSRSLENVPLISMAAYGLPAYVLLACLFRLFIVTSPPTSVRLALPETIAKSLSRRLAVLALLLYVGYLLFALVLEQTLPEPALLLLRALFSAVFALNLVWALWLLGHVTYLSIVRWPRRSVELVLIVSVAAEWLGYRNLGLAMLRGLFGTLLLLGLATLLVRLLRAIYAGLEHGNRPWQQRLRGALGIKAGEAVPGLGWLRPLSLLAVWSACALGLLWVWGLSEVGFQQLRDSVMDGFAVGSLRIVPARIVLALFALTVLLGVSGWFKGRLERNWLKRTHIERSAREALVTVSGYAGAAVALLVALGIAGMEFANLAIVAGALSVGIGFGLQNIVNNFVSGLILLFERPIKTGDWIVVGNTEGYVRKISIRHTQIQTFDQSDVIVPNSDLISGQVTNRTLLDARGRIRVPVSVTWHGNDPQQVKQLLIDTARAHPQVLKGGDSEPKVLFLAFGDGTVQFELRCFIADINQSSQVLSDLNFAIDAAFREHGVEMPARATAPMPVRQ